MELCNRIKCSGVEKLSLEKQNATLSNSQGWQTIDWYDEAFYITKQQDAENKISTTEYYIYSGMNKFGEIMAQTDRNGNKTESLLRSTITGEIMKVRNPDGSTRDYRFDSKGNVIQELNENRNYIEYIYDSEQINLVEKRELLTPLASGENIDYIYKTKPTESFAVTQYTYYTEAERVAKGLLKNIEAPTSSENPEDPIPSMLTSYEYDAAGNTTKMTISGFRSQDVATNTVYAYNTFRMVSQEISPRGYATKYFYDNNGLLYKTARNNDTEIKRTVYDALGRIAKEISPNQYNAAHDQSIANYTGDYGQRYAYYDNSNAGGGGGKRRTSTDANGYVTTYTYDQYGNLLTETLPNGAVNVYRYDVMNRLTRKSFKESASSAEVVLEEYSYAITASKTTRETITTYLNDTEKNVTTIEYDYCGRIIKKEAPNGTEVTKYNPDGTVASFVDVNGNESFYEYDGMGRQTKSWTPFENSGGIKYTYAEIDYDNAGKVREKKQHTGKVAKGVTPTLYFVSSYIQYYYNGFAKSVLDSANGNMGFEYDLDGNISKEINRTNTGENYVIDYVYDHRGNPLQKNVHVRKGDIYGNNVTDTSDMVLQTVYTYDKNGNLKTEKTPNQVVTTHSYDNMNQLIKTSRPGINESGSAVSLEVESTYDWYGRLLTVKDANVGVARFEYDKRGLLVKEINAAQGVHLYAYDRAGRKIAEVTPNNYSASAALNNMPRTEYVYDTLGRLTQQKDAYIEKTYNESSKNWTDTWVTRISKKYEYDRMGNVLKEFDALGAEAGNGATEHTYNLAGLVVTTLTPESRSRSLGYSVKYEYDAVGRKLSETDANGAVLVYEYDGMNRVTGKKIKKTPSAAAQTLQTSIYDWTGHQLSVTDADHNTIEYEYNAFGKLRKSTGPSGEGVTAYTVTNQYDNMGNLRYSVIL